jgi:CRP/FNR family cyclic AMP-dependent transcriptional regulator
MEGRLRRLTHNEAGVPMARDGIAVHPQPEHLWALLGAPQRAVLENAGRRHEHPAGTVLFQEGAPSGSALVLQSGRVTVTATGPAGSRGLLAIRVPGDIIGELAAIDRKPRSATVTAIDSVQVLRLASDRFAEVLSAHPMIALAVLKVVISRLRIANWRLVEFGETTVGQRVALMLAKLAAEHGEIIAGTTAISLSFGQEEIARMVGGSRETVVRALRVLRTEGIIRTGRRRITILQPEILGARAMRPG